METHCYQGQQRVQARTPGKKGEAEQGQGESMLEERRSEGKLERGWESVGNPYPWEEEYLCA